MPKLLVIDKSIFHTLDHCGEKLCAFVKSYNVVLPYCWDWSHRKSLPGSCEKKDISNDFYDIEPVLYLLRADGLLTNDQRLQIPLAKAAFPQKEVFEVNTFLSASRTVRHVFDDITQIIPSSHRIG